MLYKLKELGMLALGCVGWWFFWFYWSKTKLAALTAKEKLGATMAASIFVIGAILILVGVTP